MNFKIKILLILLMLSSLSWAQLSLKEQKDSISFYISQTQKKNIQTALKIKYARKAQDLSLKTGVKALIVKSNINLAEIYLDAGLNTDFLKVSKRNLQLTEKIKDTVSTAFISRELGFYYYQKVTDSAFYYFNKSKKLYWALKDEFNTAVLLLDIAITQKNEKDFTGSEISSVEGISLLESLKSNDEVRKKKAFHYNNLGLVFDQLEQYDDAILYHKKMYDIISGLKGDNQWLLDVSSNNLGLVYIHSGQYDLALKKFKDILSRKGLAENDPEFYILVLDNYAHTLHLSKQHAQLPSLYLEALSIANQFDSIAYPTIAIHHHLAEYYHEYKQQDSAKYYAYKAKEISKKYHNDDLLRSLLLLSQIEVDSIAVKHYKAYIKLNDSLQMNERKIRNKFTRIQFETNQIEERNAQIEREKLWLTILSGILLITVVLIYVIVTQRTKNKELKLIQHQQVANEEIYNLMLSQQGRIEEARTIEKKRISQELHDGVLGRLFGTRLSLDSLNMASSVEAIKTRGHYIDELQTIEQDIRKVSHELNTDFISGSGFIDIIKTLVNTQTKVFNINYSLTYDETISWDSISNKTKIHIYRLIQEALHNIYKHAKASLIQISFKLNNDVICLIISDNGVGFSSEKQKKGIGIKNMYSRIDEIEGKLDIKSEKNKGTTIRINIPT
ncbi:ATP-binding protein [Mariniflexile ostreae]|uniref:ATP-binding protein n=1 Tax=Mariniflexile ostreae TaxID=1520892 RepID=A0ABV5FA33_9FLAO